jgi:hypothetical protein
VLTKLAQVYDIENPMDFDKPVLAGEAVEVFGDTEVRQLEHLLEPLNEEMRSEWLKRMAEAKGYDSIRDVPRECFSEVHNRLDHRLNLWLKNHNPPKEPTEEHPT